MRCCIPLPVVLLDVSVLQLFVQSAVLSVKPELFPQGIRVLREKQVGGTLVYLACGPVLTMPRAYVIQFVIKIYISSAYAHLSPYGFCDTGCLAFVAQHECPN